MNDLTRWNRSGLRQLRYVDGNAATYLERLRVALERAFPDRWRAMLEPRYDAAASEGQVEYWALHHKNRKLEEQYVERGDVTWELLRSFARSCHVLTEHVDAHANGAFLRTAEAWDDLRKLVAMLDYHPVGASSATTFLAIDARDAGLVERGLQVRHRPATGPATIFETLEDVWVRPEHSRFTVVGADVSPLSFEAVGSNGPMFVAPSKVRIVPEQSALLLRRSGQGVELAGAEVKGVANGQLQVDYSGDAWKSFEVGRTVMQSAPRFRRAPWINGPNVRRSAKPHGLTGDAEGLERGSVVAWQDPEITEEVKDIHGNVTERNVWRFALVKRADAFGVELKLPDVAPQDKEANFKKGSAYNDRWPDYVGGVDTITVQPATRLKGTLVVPASSEAEEVLGELTPFGAGDLFEPVSGPSGIVSFGANEDFKPERSITMPAPPGGPDATFDNFIKWLMGGVGMAMGFPLTPELIVKIGTMIMTKDARIPSTGQLVFEAFLDLFGAGGSDELDFSSEQTAELPALFRFWHEGEAVAPAGSRPAFLPGDNVHYELWYFPKHEPGGGVPERTLTFGNRSDRGWYFFDGRPTGLGEGDWAAARIRGEDGWHPVKIMQLEEELLEVLSSDEVHERYRAPDSFAVRLQDASGAWLTAEVLELQGDYRTEIVPAGADVNNEQLPEWVHLDPCPDTSLKGAQLLAVTSDGVQTLAEVQDVQDCRVTLEPPLPRNFKHGNTTLYGNVVRAGHGERRPELRFSGGTEAERPRRLVVRQSLVSTVPDSRLAHGTRVDIDVIIDGARWQHVLHLDESGPTDRHYAVSTTEEGHLELRFGDGRRGRALPMGIDNVRVQYRVGAGDIGTIPPGSLEKLVKPHPLVRAINHLLETMGGADMERPEHMRERAPAALLSLERAVSLRDFEHLAMMHASVVRAEATYRVNARSPWDQVIVTVVPAGGYDFALSRVHDEFVSYLERRALPEVRISVDRAGEHEVSVTAKVRIDVDVFEPERVKRAVRQALADHFSRERRPIGEPVRLAEIYGVIEQVVGVEDSKCSFEHPAQADTDIVFIRDAQSVECTHEEYVP